MKDYYYILGVTQTTSRDEIKKAYRKLSLKFHPDKNDGDEFFTERFREIQEAYEILSNPIKRDLYDQEKLKNTFSSKINEENNTMPFIDFFKANKKTFEYDDNITFSWKTTNANYVEVKPFGLVSPIGTKTYKFKDLNNEYLTFQLIAENTNTKKRVVSTLTLQNLTYGNLKSKIENDIKSNEPKIISTKNPKKNIFIYWLFAVCTLAIIAYRNISLNSNKFNNKTSSSKQKQQSISGNTSNQNIDSDDLIIKKLSSEIEIQYKHEGIEDFLISFIEDDSKYVDKNNWFNFHYLKFNLGSSVIDNTSITEVKNIAEVMKVYPNVTIKIGAYTDNVGDETENIKLSGYRAAAVKKLLVNMGIDDIRLESEGYGSQHPMYSNDNEEGRMQNNRIAISVRQK